MAARKRNLEVIHPHAAGIDIGGEKHYVAVPPQSHDEPVRCFGCYTADLNAMADWLLACDIDIVVMESTGVYWIPVYDLLESRGLTVHLVNARHVKNVSGRKSDVLDCQWLQQLMSFGLLSGAFRPRGEICALRTISRHRETLIAEQARWIQRMQKALTQMNVQLAHAVTDVTGMTGLAIIRAIVAGVREPEELARLRNYRCRKNAAELARALQGTWRQEHLFTLGQALQMYEVHAERIAEVDAQLQRMLAGMRQHDGVVEIKRNKGRAKNAPRFDVRQALYGLCGVDLTCVEGVDASTALKVLAELGDDLSRFATAKQFCSWLGLCPGTRISGGKRLSGVSKRIANPVARALKLAAMGLSRSQCSLGAYYRRMAARVSAGKAITATAHKLARILYAMLTKQEAFKPQDLEVYEDRYRERTLAYLRRKAALMGFELQPTAAT
jgi:transposase